MIKSYRYCIQYYTKNYFRFTYQMIRNELINLEYNNKNKLIKSLALLMNKREESNGKCGTYIIKRIFVVVILRLQLIHRSIIG